jgi:hypothetical protein
MDPHSLLNPDPDSQYGSGSTKSSESGSTTLLITGTHGCRIYNRLGIGGVQLPVPSGPWAICSYGAAAAHCTAVACLETSLHCAPFYIMIVQRISAISCGAVVG